MDLGQIEAVERAIDGTEAAKESARRSPGRIGRVLTTALGLAAAAAVLLALAQVAIDAGLASAAWDVVDLGR